MFLSTFLMSEEKTQKCSFFRHQETGIQVNINVRNQSKSSKKRRKSALFERFDSLNYTTLGLAVN
jgi:hypothetical protein